LTERFAIGQIASTQQFWDSQDHEVIELSQYLDQRRIPKTKLNASESGALGSVSWKVLHPSSGWSGENDNAASLCLLLEYAGKRILLPGDLEGKGIASLVELPARPCHVLMAPHHGSTTLDPTEMLLWCQPEVIVISGNHRANQQRVVDKYRIVPARLGITFRDGAVQVRIDKSGHLTSWNWREERWLPLP
jgi:competence protein ComEC